MNQKCYHCGNKIKKANHSYYKAKAFCNPKCVNAFKAEEKRKEDEKNEVKHNSWLDSLLKFKSS